MENIEAQLNDFKEYCYNHFHMEFTCEDTFLLTNLHTAQAKIYYWLGWNGCSCCNDLTNLTSCCCGGNIQNYIFELAYYYSNTQYADNIKEVEQTTYLNMLNNGLIRL